MFRHSIYILPLYYISNIVSFQSRIYLEKAGTRFVPDDMDALLLDTWSVETTMACAYRCYNNFRCRTFNFDSSTSQCQLFEGDTVATGSMVEMSSSAFIAGYIDVSELDFENYNRLCYRCDSTRFLRCVAGQCKCQEYTYWNGTMCLPQSPVPCTQCEQNMNMCRVDMGLDCQSFNRCHCEYIVSIRISMLQRFDHQIIFVRALQSYSIDDLRLRRSIKQGHMNRASLFCRCKQYLP